MTAGPPVTDGRRRRRIIAICVALVLAAVAAVVIVVVAATGSTSSNPGSPDTAAAAWGKALFTHDSHAVQSLTCPGHSTAGDNIDLIVAQGTGVKVQSTTPQGHDSWDVGLITTGPGGGTTLHVGVHKVSGKYYVC